MWTVSTSLVSDRWLDDWCYLQSILSTSLGAQKNNGYRTHQSLAVDYPF